LALGLSGHLVKLGKLESFDYLLKGHELLSIGVLLGILITLGFNFFSCVTKIYML